MKNYYDVLVAGSGPAGTVAAIAAARNGVKVLLVERYAFLGGMLTAGMVSPINAFYNMQGKQIVGGIPHEIVRRLEKIGGVFPGGHLRSAYLSSYTHTPFDVESMKRILLEMTEEENICFLLHTFVAGTIVESNKVKGVKVVNKSGTYGIKAKIVIDASGDGDVAAAGGADYQKGGKQGECMAGSLFIRMGNIDEKQVMDYVKKHPNEFVLSEDPFIKESNAEVASKISNLSDIHAVRGMFDTVKKAQKEGEFPSTRNQVMFVFSPKRNEVYINSTNVVHMDGSNEEDLTYAELETRKQVPKVVNFFIKYIPGFRNAYLINTATQIGVRESRRIIGDYILTINDVLQAKKFYDGIAKGAYPSDIHTPDGGLVHKHVQRGSDYDIPYRCLIPKKLNNILVAGRSISADRLAMGSIREMAQCMAMGQAAGTAAAMSVKEEIIPRKLNISSLRENLISQGAII